MLATALLVPGPATAVTVIVPDAHPTLQAALDQSSADTVLVRDGEYLDPTTVSRPVTIAAARLGGYYDQAAYPALGPVTITGFPSSAAFFTGVHFRGPVTQTSYMRAMFESCRFDSGYVMTAYSAEWVKMRGCLVLGGAVLHGSYVEVLGCTFLGGTLAASSEGDMRIRDNFVMGPAATGMNIVSGDTGGDVSENTVTGVTNGVVFTPAGLNPVFRRNDVHDCSGNAYVSTAGGYGSGWFHSNIARRCGGHGFEIGSGATLQGNTVDSVGGAGIHLADVVGYQAGIFTFDANTIRHAGGRGIDIGTGHEPATVSSNRVLACGDDGIRLASTGTAHHNVVGRCAGNGLVATNGAYLTIQSNTLYSNRGSGLVLHLTNSTGVDQNVATANERWGAEVTGGSAPPFHCNDWYANIAGAVTGGAPGGTDLSLAPLFCDMSHDDVSLSAVSALLAPPGGCGPIGALGQGCAYPTVRVEDGERDRSFLFSATPSPSRGSVRFTWSPLGGPGRIELYDATGARRWEQDLQSDRTSFVWNGRGRDGTTVPAGVYFARLRLADRTLRERVVLIR